MSLAFSLITEILKPIQPWFLLSEDLNSSELGKYALKKFPRSQHQPSLITASKNLATVRHLHQVFVLLRGRIIDETKSTVKIHFICQMCGCSMLNLCFLCSQSCSASHSVCFVKFCVTAFVCPTIADLYI